MMKHLLPFLLAGLFLPALASAQRNCCDIKREAGQKLYDQGKYKEAIAKWEEGQGKGVNGCPDADPCPDLANLIAKAQKKISDRDAAAQRQRAAAAEAERQDQDQADELQRARDKADDDLWDVLKDGDAADCDKYLEKYPNGRHAKEARDRKAKLAVPANFVRVTGGTFQMGDVMGDNLQTDETVHTVAVSTFYLSKTEVTSTSTTPSALLPAAPSPTTPAGAGAAAR